MLTSQYEDDLLICKKSDNEKVELVAHIPEYQCDNGRKMDEEWVSDSLN